jgi:membrane protease subunit HflC
VKYITPFILIVVVLGGLYLAVYTVDETEQVIITQFGKPIGDPMTRPGFHFKIPFIQKANYFHKNILAWDGESGQVPTLDKTFISIDTFARWKIVNPLKFFRTVNNVTGAQARLDDILDAAARNVITSYPLIETVRRTNRKLDTFEMTDERIEQKRPLGEIKMGREKVIEAIMNQARPKLAMFGIELVYMEIKRLNYVEEVRKAVYQRMIAERKRIAEKFRSEGRGQSKRIEGEMEKDLKKIRSLAYRRAEEIKGKADAEATKIYAEAYGRDPGFYSFLETLNAYTQTMDESTSLVLSTDSDFLKYFEGYKQKP